MIIYLPISCTSVARR